MEPAAAVAGTEPLHMGRTGELSRRPRENTSSTRALLTFGPTSSIMVYIILYHNTVAVL